MTGLRFHSRRTIAGVTLAALLLVLQAGSAEAQNDEARAKAFFLAGKEHYQAAKAASRQDQLALYVQALADFHEALRLVRRSSALLMVAHCYRYIGLPDRALAHYQEYLVAWGQESPGRPAPYLKDVTDRIEELKRRVAEVKRAEGLLRSGDPDSALEVLKAELALVRWPRIMVGIALCYEKLKQQALALGSIRDAIASWEQQRVAWKRDAPSQDAPEYRELEQRLVSLRQIEARMAAMGESSSIEPPPPSAPATLPVRRNNLWLVTGIATAALAIGFEAMAWAAYAKGNDLFTNDPDFETYRNLTIAGHVVAAVMAAGSGASFLLYYFSGKRPKERRASLGVAPLAGGLWVGGRVRF